jgi:hypothetical protein
MLATEGLPACTTIGESVVAKPDGDSIGVAIELQPRDLDSGGALRRGSGALYRVIPEPFAALRELLG